MPRKQVEGHASKQAPANRTIRYTNIIYKRVGCVGQSSDLAQAIKWYNNGNTVKVIEQRQDFRLIRNSAYIQYNGINNTTIYTWHKKSGQAPTQKQLNHINKINEHATNGTSQMVCTF